MQTPTLHTDHRSGTRYARVEYSPDSEGNARTAAFALEQGTLIETVEWIGTDPDWAWAGEVNPALASDPDLCERVAAFLRANSDGQS